MARGGTCGGAIVIESLVMAWQWTLAWWDFLRGNPWENQ